MPKYPGISPYDNEKGTLGTAKKRWEKLYVKEIESDTVSGINATIENLATTAENSVSAAVSAKNDAVAAKTAAQAAQTAAETAAAGIQSVVESDVDNTLSISGVAADAKVTGDWLRDIAKPVTLDTSMPETAYADEYMKVTTDSEGRVLYGVKRDGTFTWQKGVPKHLQDKINELAAPTIDNDEYMYVMLDSEGHVLFGVKRDGSFDWQKGVPKPVREKLEEVAQTVIDSEEFVQLTQDSEGKLIEGTRIDGAKVFFSPVIFRKTVSYEYNDDTKDTSDAYEKLAGKRVSILGDSISTYNGYSYLNPTYPNGNVDSVNKTWWGQVIEHFGMSLLKDNAIGGSTVTGDSTLTEINGMDTPGCSEFRVNNLAVSGVSPDIILIYLGVNDINIRNIANSIGHINQNDGVPTEGEIYDFARAYDLMLYKIRTRYPNALIFCSALPFHIFGNGFPYNNTKGMSFVAANEAIREACNHMGAFYVDLHSRGVMTGNIHPQLEGMTKIARGFIKKILEVV